MKIINFRFAHEYFLHINKITKELEGLCNEEWAESAACVPMDFMGYETDASEVTKRRERIIKLMSEFTALVGQKGGVGLWPPLSKAVEGYAHVIQKIEDFA